MGATAGSARIRGFRRSDRNDVYEVCVRTADVGGDARGRWITDDLMPDLFAGPYLEHAPQLAFVLEDAGRVVGYVLGTADTEEFVRFYRQTWIPSMLDRYPVPAGPPQTPDEAMIAMHHRPERMLLAELAPFPAHLHIDLLPAYQGQGYGRTLMAHLLPALAQEGAVAVHLGMVTSNTGAHAFYDRLGFRVIDVPDPGPLTYLGRSTAPVASSHEPA